MDDTKNYPQPDFHYQRKDTVRFTYNDKILLGKVKKYWQGQSADKVIIENALGRIIEIHENQVVSVVK